MPTIWFSLKKSLHCKSDQSDVYDPKTRKQLGSILTRKARKSGCSRSIETLKDVIHGSKRDTEKPVNCSPRSIGSSEFFNPITHEVILSNSKCELKITGFRSAFQDSSATSAGSGDSTFLGTLTPGTPIPGGSSTMHYFNPQFKNSKAASSRKNGSVLLECGGSGFGGTFGNNWNNSASKPRGGGDSVPVEGFGSLTCHKCREHFVRRESLEEHHLLKHAVTELVEGDSSRQIVEMICKTNQGGRIEKVFKIHITQKALARFDEYKETVKTNASKLPTKHPRCLADGNELLRFYGTTLSCTLGINGSSTLCLSDKCCVCRILRNGVFSHKDIKNGIGVFTTSTSGRAFECIESFEEDGFTRKALIVCRVIAGRVHKPLENIQEMAGQVGFDSLAGKMGLHANIEELYLLNPRALLPYFVVICKT